MAYEILLSLQFSIHGIKGTLNKVNSEEAQILYGYHISILNVHCYITST